MIRRNVSILLGLVLAPGIVAAGQQPQTSSAANGANASYVQGVGPGYWPTPGLGLTLNLSAGSAVCDNAWVTYTGGTLTMAGSSTNYVVLDLTNSCAPASNTIGFTDASIPIASVVTAASAITTVSDLRVWGFMGARIVNNVAYATRFTGADAAAKISAAIAALPSTGGTVDGGGLTGVQTWGSDPFGGTTKPITLRLGASTTAVNANVTVPSTTTVMFSQGSVLSVSTGVTITWNGGMTAGTYKIFALNGTGTVAFARNSGIPYILPQWYGAKGDGLTDDTAAIKNAVNAASPVFGTVFFPNGNYLVCSTLPILAAVHYLGVGSGEFGSQITACSTFPLDSPIMANTSGAIASPASVQEGANIENLWLNGRNLADGLYLNGVRSSKVSRIGVTAVGDTRTFAISSISATSNTISITTSVNHDFVVGQALDIEGVTNSSYDQITCTVQTVPSSTQLTCNNKFLGSVAASSGGTVQHALFGFTTQGSMTSGGPDAGENFLYDIRTVTTWGGLHVRQFSLANPVIGTYLYGTRFQVAARAIFLEDASANSSTPPESTDIYSSFNDCASLTAVGIEDQGTLNSLHNVLAENSPGAGTNTSIWLRPGSNSQVYEGLQTNSGWNVAIGAAYAGTASAVPTPLGTYLGTRSSAAGMPALGQLATLGWNLTYGTDSNITNSASQLLCASGTAATPVNMLRCSINGGSAFNLVGDTLAQTLSNKTLSNVRFSLTNPAIETSNYTLTNTDSGKAFSNSGAGGAVTLTLPALLGGLTYIFIVDAAQTLTVRASNGAVIRVGGSESMVNGAASTSTVGNTLILYGDPTNTSRWVAVSVIGTWTVA